MDLKKREERERERKEQINRHLSAYHRRCILGFVGFHVTQLL